MGRFGLAVRTFFRVWSDEAFAKQVERLLAGKPSVEVQPKPQPKPERVEIKAPRRSEAVTLLAALQREARFVDFIKEPIAGYSDAQIGAAVRDIHKGCGVVVDRLFSVQPLVQAEEGASIEVPRGFDPAQYRLTGQVAREAPFHGQLCHHGWRAAKCELPEWTGSDASALVIAPAEVEVK